MAMIKCPECGKEISSKSDKCQFCGCPSSEWTSVGKDGVVMCPQCGREYDKKLGYCYHCGYGSQKTEEKKSPVLAIVLSIIIAIVAISAISYKIWDDLTTTDEEIDELLGGDGIVEDDYEEYTLRVYK